MNFNSSILKLQSILISLNNTGHLSNNGDRNVITRFQKLFKETSNVTEEEHMAFFLFLNTQLSVSEDLKNDPNIGLFVHICPTIDIKFLIDILFECGLECYLNKIISFCPTIVVTEILETLITKLQDPQFHKKHFSDTYVTDITLATFIQLHNLKLKNIKNENTNVLCMLFEELVQMNENVILLSITQNAQEEIVKFTGIQVYHFFVLLGNCLDIYNSLDVINEKNNIYKLSILSKNEQKTDRYSEYLKNCVDRLLASCECIVKEFTLVTWISWADTFMDNSDDSIQKLVGLTVNSVCEILDQSSFSVSDATKYCLSHFKIKPKTEDDLIMEADLDTIVTTLKSLPGNEKWLTALLHYPNVYKDITGFKAVKENCSFATEDMLCKIMTDVLFIIQTEDSTSEELKELFLECFKSLKLEQQLQEANKLLINGYDNFLKLPSFHTNLTETCNKWAKSKDEEIFQKILYLCLQSPYCTVYKLCLAAIQYDQINTAIDFLLKLKNICMLDSFVCNVKKPYNQTKLLFVALNQLTMELSKQDGDQFVKLVTSLMAVGLLDSNFIRSEVFKNIVQAVSCENYQDVILYLNILKECTRMECYTSYTILLAFLGHVLDSVTWDFKSYSDAKYVVRKLCVSIIQTYLDKINVEKDLAWLRNEVRDLFIGNRVYFCDLWFSHDLKFPFITNDLSTNLLILLHTKVKRQAIIDAIRSKKDSLFAFENLIQVALFKVLPFLLDVEWRTLYSRLQLLLIDFHLEPVEIEWRALELFGALHMLRYLAMEDELSGPSYNYCLHNYGLLIKAVLPTLPQTYHMDLFKDLCLYLDSKMIEPMGSVVLSSTLLSLVDMMPMELVSEVNDLVTQHQFLSDEVRKALVSKCGMKLLENDVKVVDINK